jgi:hypothetical protein
MRSDRNIPRNRHRVYHLPFRQIRTGIEDLIAIQIDHHPPKCGYFQLRLHSRIGNVKTDRKGDAG